MCADIARSHHEHWDGKGYPLGLTGEEIPICARIVALADVFDAISSRRCYKKAKPFKDVLSIIVENSGTHFDPDCVAAFFKSIDDIRDVFEKLKD